MKFIQLFFFAVISLASYGSECNLKSPIATFQPRFAQYFRIDYFKKFRIISIGKNEDRYLLTSHQDIDCSIALTKIMIPVKKVAMMSTTYLPALQLLNQEKTLFAFQGKRYVVSQAFHLDHVQEVATTLSAEYLLGLKADLIMGQDFNLTSPKQKEVFRHFNIPFVINKDFEEVTPLGRAEWLIFIASFYDQEELAKKIFTEISDAYLKLKEKNAKRPLRPKVLVGEIRNGKWVTNGGESDLGRMIADAGGDMLLSRPSANTQEISLEELHQMKTALDSIDFWLPHNMWASHAEVVSSMSKDSRYSLIKGKNIFNNNLITNKYKFNDYWETGMQRPDLMLLDLVALFHPDEYKNHKLRWYKKI